MAGKTSPRCAYTTPWRLRSEVLLAGDKQLNRNRACLQSVAYSMTPWSSNSRGQRMLQGNALHILSSSAACLSVHLEGIRDGQRQEFEER